MQLNRADQSLLVTNQDLGSMRPRQDDLKQKSHLNW